MLQTVRRLYVFTLRTGRQMADEDPCGRRDAEMCVCVCVCVELTTVHHWHVRQPDLSPATHLYYWQNDNMLRVDRCTH